MRAYEAFKGWTLGPVPESTSTPSGTSSVTTRKTRKPRSLTPPSPTSAESTHAVTDSTRDVTQDAPELTEDQQKFILCCGFFIKQAREQGQEEKLRSTIEGRFFGEWSVPLSKDMALTASRTYHSIRRELEWVTLATRSIVPETSWQLVLVMPLRDIFVHMRPSIAQYQYNQRRLGLDPSTIRAHYQDIYNRTVSKDENAGELKLGDGGAIDLTVDIEDPVYKDTRIDIDD